MGTDIACTNHLERGLKMKVPYNASLHSLYPSKSKVKPAIQSLIWLVFLIPSLALSQDALELPGAPVWNPPPESRHVLENSLTFRISERGMLLFEQRLPSIIGRFGLSVDEGSFNAMELGYDKPIEIEKLQLPQETKATLILLHGLLKKWFRPYPLDLIQPRLRIGDSAFVAQFQRFALVTDPELMNNLGLTQGVVLAIELEAREVRVAATEILLQDQLREWLRFRLTRPSLRIRATDAPLKMRVPFHVVLQPDGSLFFRALGVQENLAAMQVQFQYGALVAPRFTLQIQSEVIDENGSSRIVTENLSVNSQQIEAELKSSLPKLLDPLRNSISEMMDTHLPRFLNEKAAQFVRGAMEEVKPLPPPGAGDQVVTPFVYGVILKDLVAEPTNGSSNRSALRIKLDGFLEDQNNPHLAPTELPSKEAQFRFAKQVPHDVSLSLHQSFLNRALQLSFNRGYFDRLELSNAATQSSQLTDEEGCPANANSADIPYVRLLAQPRIFALAPGTYQPKGTAIPTDGKSSSFAGLQLNLRVPPCTVAGFQRMGIRDEFALEMTTVIRLVPDGGGLKMQLWDILPSTVKPEAGTIRRFGDALSRFFRGRSVMQELLQRLDETAQGWRRDSATLPGGFHPLPQVADLRFETSAVDLEPDGHLVMYMSYMLAKRSEASHLSLPPTVMNERIRVSELSETRSSR